MPRWKRIKVSEAASCWFVEDKSRLLFFRGPTADQWAGGTRYAMPFLSEDAAEIVARDLETRGYGPLSVLEEKAEE